MEGGTLRLRVVAHEMRRDILRMTHAAQSGHPGGSLSAIDMLACLYFSEMRHDPKNPAWEDRDRFVLSKGHASPALYAVLAKAGYLPADELLSFRKFGSRLQGHPERMYLPGVEFSTGSLGQGLSAAHGMALGLKLTGRDSRVYCMVGDGELQEGQVWEAMMAAAHRRSAGLCVLLDHNRLQIDGEVERIKGEEPVVAKAVSFGWNAFSFDGHDFEAILDALGQARACTDRPSFLVAETVKGKGVSFMENCVDFHGKAPNDAELVQGMAELDEALAAMGAQG